jgi:hypothetical protein
MFLPLSKVIDNNKLLDNYEKIKNDYLDFVKKDYLLDYSHDYNLVCDDLTQLKIPPKTGHFWQVCPLIIGGKVIPLLPMEVQNCFTVNLLMSFEVKPVLAVFSLLEPQSVVDPHYDADDDIIMKNSHVPVHKRKTSVVKYHYSIDIPKGNKCGLKVLDELRILKNKDLNPFVETSIHSAFNKSHKRRGALIVSYLKHEIYPELEKIK